MRSFVALFAIAALFGFVVDVVYWFIAHVEPAGLALLSVMTVALVFAAGYAVLAERDADLEGDRPDETYDRVAGEEVEIFTTQTPWPIVTAFCALCVLVGALWIPLLAAIALVALVLCLWQLGAESSRI